MWNYGIKFVMKNVCVCVCVCVCVPHHVLTICEVISSNRSWQFCVYMFIHHILTILLWDYTIKIFIIIFCVNCALFDIHVNSTIYVFVLFDINVVRQFCVLHCLYDFANKNLSLFVVLIIIKYINLCFLLDDIHLTRKFYVNVLC